MTFKTKVTKTDVLLLFILYFFWLEGPAASFVVVGVDKEGRVNDC